MLLIGAVTGAAFLVGLLHLLEHTYEMEGTFTDAAGLRSGDDVKLAGVKVGRVTGIHADRDEGLVEVEWVVNDGVDIKDGADADIALETLLGSKFIRIPTPTRGDHLMADLPRAERLIPLRGLCAPTACARPAPPRRSTSSTSPATPPSASRPPTTTSSTADQPARGHHRGQAGDRHRPHQAASTRCRRRSTSATASSARCSTTPTSWPRTWPTKDQTLVQLIDSSRVILDFLVRAACRSWPRRSGAAATRCGRSPC